MRVAVRWASLMCVGVLLEACAPPRPSAVLVVRNLQSKCALVAFSFCDALGTSERVGVQPLRRARGSTSIRRAERDARAAARLRALRAGERGGLH